MKPTEAQFEQLTAYLDGELSESERREVDALLARDPGAAALLESLRQVSESVAALPREHAPYGLSAAVQDRMARRSLLDGRSQESGRLPPLVMWMNRLAVAACLALVCTAGWLGMQNRVAHAPVPAANEITQGPDVPLDSTFADAREVTALNASTESNAVPTGGAWAPPLSSDAPANGMVAAVYQGPGEFERRLIKTGVSNFDIQRADLSSFSNRIVIEAEDAETRDKIVRLVADIARKNEIPDGNTERLPEPVQARQSFFVVQSQGNTAPSPGSEETWIGVNAPPKAAAELMACVSQVQEESRSPIQMAVNGCMVETPKQASHLVTMNAARNQRLLNPIMKSEPPAAVASAPPPSSAVPARASGGARSAGIKQVEKENLKEDSTRSVGGFRKDTDAKSPGFTEKSESNARDEGARADAVHEDDVEIESKTTKQPPPQEAKVVDHDRPEEVITKANGQRDAGSARQASREPYVGGRAAASPATRPASGARERKHDMKDDTGVALEPPGDGRMGPHPPDVAPIDGCVTLSICVRNPVTQRANAGPTTTSQASDTLRSPAPAQQRQTSMPAAGAARD